MGPTKRRATHLSALQSQTHRWLRHALHAPCLICNQFRDGHSLCPDCQTALDQRRWGVSSLSIGETRIPVLWRESYGGLLTDAILRAKYFGHWEVARLLGRVLGGLPKPWLGAEPLLVPVPLATRRLSGRGFNQSAMIGQSLAKTWRLEMKPRWLRKTSSSQRQATLTKEKRRLNLAGLFHASPAIAGRRIVLVDDIMTSGATLQEAARAIRESGGVVIAAAVIARVIQPPARLQSGPPRKLHHVQRRFI